MNANTITFRKKIQSYIIDILDYEDMENATTKDELIHFVDCFNSEYYYGFNKQQHPNIFDAFVDYLWGLPSCLNIEYSNYKIKEIVRDWHEQTKEEASKYKEEASINQYFRLLYRELERMCKEYEIDFI